MLSPVLDGVLAAQQGGVLAGSLHVGFTIKAFGALLGTSASSRGPARSKLQ